MSPCIDSSLPLIVSKYFAIKREYRISLFFTLSSSSDFISSGSILYHVVLLNVTNHMVCEFSVKIQSSAARAIFGFNVVVSRRRSSSGGRRQSFILRTHARPRALPLSTTLTNTHKHTHPTTTIYIYTLSISRTHTHRRQGIGKGRGSWFFRVWKKIRGKGFAKTLISSKIFRPGFS